VAAAADFPLKSQSSTVIAWPKAVCLLGMLLSRLSEMEGTHCCIHIAGSYWFYCSYTYHTQCEVMFHMLKWYKANLKCNWKLQVVLLQVRHFTVIFSLSSKWLSSNRPDNCSQDICCRRRFALLQLNLNCWKLKCSKPKQVVVSYLITHSMV
jgi:hypothetical protein